MAFIEDPNEFLSTDDFATTGTYLGGDLVGIFDTEYVDGGGAAVSVSGYMPTFLVATVDTLPMQTGHIVNIYGLDYEIVDMQRDVNEMFTKLILMER